MKKGDRHLAAVRFFEFHARFSEPSPYARRDGIRGWALLLLAGSARPDEGMWLLDSPPSKLLKQRHDFEPTADWLEHLRKSSVRFGAGGSASFVSPDGLVMTNHHVGSDALQRMSSKKRNYYRDGFLARTRADEFR